MQIAENKTKLRTYQKDLIRGIYERFSTQRRVMAQLPTGGGKTVIFATIANEMLARGERVLILAHREELITQAAEKLAAIANVTPGIIKAGRKADYPLPLQVASVQSLRRRMAHLGDFGLVIIDEAHHSSSQTYQAILDSQPHAYHLGFTATPCRADGEGFDHLFDSLICGPNVADLIRAGYLSQYRLFAAKRTMKTAGCRLTAGDYNTNDIASQNNAIELSGDLVRAYLDYAQGKRCLVFAVNVEHSQQIARRYNQNGIPAIHLDALTPAGDRRKALEQFKNGEIKVISNCGLFTEGLDIPALEAVQLARPTQSLGLYLQMVGRVLRPFAGKDNAIIIDHTGNHIEHQLPHHAHDWSLSPRPKQVKGKAPAEAPPERIEKPIHEKTSALLAEIEIRLDDACSASIVASLLEMQKFFGYKSAWLGFTAKKRGLPIPVLREIGQFLGYKRGWEFYP